MTNRTITLRSDLVEKLEQLAERQGRSVDDVFEEMVSYYSLSLGGIWALAVAEGMETAEINWIDDSDASVNSHDDFERHLREKWNESQENDPN